MRQAALGFMIMMAATSIFGAIQLFAENERLTNMTWWETQFARAASCMNMNDIASPLACWQRQANADVAKS